MRDWHNRFEGMLWRVTPDGVETQKGIQRTGGEPLSVRLYLAIWHREIMEAVEATGCPLALLLMTICTENGNAKVSGQRLKVRPLRKEPGYKSDEKTPHRISVGPCHLLISTARAVMGGDPNVDRKWLQDIGQNIRCAARFISDQRHKTGYDPILVAAAYNSGGLYEATGQFQNPWHLKSYGDHLDRAAKWYGDACQVIKEQREVGAFNLDLDEG